MPLTEETLRERLTDAETRFNAAKVKKDQAEASVQEAENECLRLQGEYRAIQALVDYESIAEKSKDVTISSMAVEGGAKHGRG